MEEKRGKEGECEGEREVGREKEGRGETGLELNWAGGEAG